MRSRSPANSADSSPPSPDFTSRMASLSSVGSRGTSSWRSRSSATCRALGERLGLVGERRVLGRRARGRPRCRRRARCHSRQVRDDRGQLGVPLVEPLGQPRVGVRLGRGQLLLELGVLVDAGLRRPRTSALLPLVVGLRSGQTTSAGHPRVAGTGARERLGRSTSRRGGLLGVAGLEAGDAAAGVEDLLLAGVERVALRAHVGVDDAARRGAARRERVAAGAGHLGLDVRPGGCPSSWLSFSVAAGSPPRRGRDVNRNQRQSQCATADQREFTDATAIARGDARATCAAHRLRPWTHATRAWTPGIGGGPATPGAAPRPGRRASLG